MTPDFILAQSKPLQPVKSKHVGERFSLSLSLCLSGFPLCDSAFQMEKRRGRMKKKKEEEEKEKEETKKRIP